MSPIHTLINDTLALDEKATAVPWTNEPVFDSFETAIVAPDVPDEGSPNVIASTLCDETNMRQAVLNAKAIAAFRSSAPKLARALKIAVEALEAVKVIGAPVTEDDCNSVEAACAIQALAAIEREAGK